jgi:AraC family transcriptional regulator of adaptative response / DNA-3-methyladenine glycosylase II
VQEAKRLIDRTSMTLAEIGFAAGFGSVRRFNDAFAATYRRPPSSFRRRR